jgi:putative endonuclease
MNRGQEGENIAAAEYQKNGYSIVGRNVRVHSSKQVGEIDIVARKGLELVFVEVKARASRTFGLPAEAIGYHKRTRLVRACKLFMLRHPQYADWNWRIDVVEVYLDKSSNSVIILENAIEDY